MSYRAHHEDTKTSRESGAFDVLLKPFQPEEFLSMAERFFSKTHLEEGQVMSTQQEPISDEIFLPGIGEDRAFFRLWGTRGSTPVSGPRYIRHGGNTSCMEINCEGEIIIIDAGTGIRDLGTVLAAQEPRRLHILVSHTHWDHIQGFPFFIPAYVPGFELVIYGVSGLGKDLKSLFKGQLDRDYFPVQIEDMKADIEFRHLSDNPVEIGDCEIFWEFTHHPGATIGFRIDLGGKKIGYITDNEFLQGYLGSPEHISIDSELVVSHRKLLDFISDSDILIGEAQYTNEEYQSKIGWGHTSLSNACLLSHLANIRRWIITHHDPAYDDEFLQQKLNLTRQVLERLGYPIEVSHAYDGMIQYL